MHEATEKKILEKYNRQVSAVSKIVLPDTLISHGQQVAPRFKGVYDNVSETSVFYDDQPHLYFQQFANGIRMPMISVTTVIHALTKPFDMMVMSLRCAKKSGYTCDYLDTSEWGDLSTSERAKRIREAWETNSKVSTDYGSFAHAVMEGVTIEPERDVHEVYQEQSAIYQQENCAIPVFADIYQRNYIRKLQKEGWSIIAEPLIYDMDALIAGQSDVVAIHHEQKLIRILDFKTNKERPDRAKVYSKMEGTLSHIDDYAYSHYCLQLCIYQRMVSNLFPDYEYDENYLLWLNRDTQQIEELLINPEEWAQEVDEVLSDLNYLKNKIYDIYQVERYRQAV